MEGGIGGLEKTKGDYSSRTLRLGLGSKEKTSDCGEGKKCSFEEGGGWYIGTHASDPQTRRRN